MKNKILFCLTVSACPLTAHAEVVLANGFIGGMPACYEQYFQQPKQTPYLHRALVLSKTPKATAIGFHTVPISGKLLVGDWVIAQSYTVQSELPQLPDGTPYRELRPAPRKSEQSCQEYARVLIQTARDAADENRRFAKQADYIPYDVEEWLRYLRMHVGQILSFP